MHDCNIISLKDQINILLYREINDYFSNILLIVLQLLIKVD